MSDSPLRCSFCHKDQASVRKLIAGQNACICDECVALCVNLVKDDSALPTSGDRVEARVVDAALKRERDGDSES